MRTGRVLLTAIVFLWVPLTQIQAQQMPYLPCTADLEAPYGVNTTLTRRNGGEFENREEALKLISATTAEYVRIPLYWDNFCSSEGTVTGKMYDAVMESLDPTPLCAVGTISPRLDKNTTAWTDPAAFSTYLKELLRRYRGKISDWEVFSGSDEIYSKGEKISAARYHSVLKGVSRMIKSANPNSRILLGTPYGLKPSFLDSLSACGTQDYIDIVTFSSYSNPEEIPSLALIIRRAMSRGNWSKPVWLTNASCGYRPSPDIPYSFWEKDVPSALKSAGITARKTRVTVIRGALNKYEIDRFLSGTFADVKLIQAAELGSLDAKTDRILIPGKNVPQSEIERYVKDGGIVIVGSPRWPDALHLGTVPGKGRYLGDDRLEKGDSMEKLQIKDGNVTSAFYRLACGGGAIALAGKGPGVYVDWEAEQAEKVARIHILAFASGVDKVFWNGIRSRESGKRLNSDFAGLCHADLSIKPAYTAYKALLSMLPAGSSRPVLNNVQGAYVASWTRTDGVKVHAVWDVGEAYCGKVSTSGKAVIYNHLGEKLKTAPAPGPGVIYVVGAEKVELIK